MTRAGGGKRVVSAKMMVMVVVVGVVIAHCWGEVIGNDKVKEDHVIVDNDELLEKSGLDGEVMFGIDRSNRESDCGFATSGRDDMLQPSADSLQDLLLNIVHDAKIDCFLGNRTAGKLEALFMVSNAVRDVSEYSHLGDCLALLYSKISNRCLSHTTWNDDAQLLWLIELMELRYRVENMPPEEYILILIQLTHEFMINIAEENYFASVLQLPIFCKEDNLIWNGTISIPHSIEDTNSEFDSNKHQALLFLQRITYTMMQRMNVTSITNSALLKSYCTLKRDDETNTMCKIVTTMSSSTCPVSSQEGINTLKALVPLLAGATTSAGSVAGTVYWTNSGTGSVYLSSVGSFSRLSNFFDISNMAAGPVVLSIAPVAATYGSLCFVLPKNFAGTLSKIVSGVATVAAPFSVFSLLTINGAGYMSIMRTLASMGGGTIISGGGGAAVGVGVLATIAVVGVYAISLGTYAFTTFSLNLLRRRANDLTTTESFHLLEADARQLMAARSRDHANTSFWEVKEDTERFWKAILILLGALILGITILYWQVEKRKAKSLDSNDMNFSHEIQLTKEGEGVRVDTKLQELKTLEDMEKMRLHMSVEEYETFLQKQKELLKSVHEDIKSEAVQLSFCQY